MKFLHLNVESFTYFDALLYFLEEEKPDIVSFVEATDGDFFHSGTKKDYVGEIADRFSWNPFFYPTIFREFGDYEIGYGAAVLSRFDLSVEKKMFLGNSEETHLSHDHISVSDRPKYEKYPYCWKWNFPFLSTIIHSDNGDIRILSAHSHVSYECFETLQIWQNAEKIAEYISGISDDLPLILAGDFNIRNESMAIKTLSEIAQHESEKFHNTLSREIHPLFKNHPNHPGLWIDHIFTKNLTDTLCETKEVTVSDHLPLILTFPYDLRRLH